VPGRSKQGAVGAFDLKPRMSEKSDQGAGESRPLHTLRLFFGCVLAQPSKEIRSKAYSADGRALRLEGIQL
jgi:hypothetical protein